MSREQAAASRLWVLKIGSALLTNDGKGLDELALDRWCQEIAQLLAEGKRFVLTSSGAVAEGMQRLGWKSRPSELYNLQAAAAVGQMGLIQAYESRFRRFGILTAQVLLTHNDLADRTAYLNARSTLRRLLELGVLPIINENDTVATEEIRFGDNDTLAALVANLIEAEMLVILTDQQGLYTADPRQHPEATLLSEVEAGDPALEAMASPSGGHLGRGGMATKVRAAKIAARSGCPMWLASGRLPQVLLRVAKAENIGTFFAARLGRLAARKRWLLGQLHVAGSVTLDAGAAAKLCAQSVSLLPIGVTAVQGDFRRGELVRCLAPDGREIARGLSNYSALETAKILRQPSSKLPEILGSAMDAVELIHRDNLVLL
jgi:glutamate 5-kinase